jgi:hypothetical protein
MKYLAGVLLPLSLFLAACSSQFPLVKPGKIHQRYFPHTKKVLVYSIAPPSRLVKKSGQPCDTIAITA